MKRGSTPWLAVAALAVVAIALVLRFFQAEAQSLWYDEGTSVALATRSLVQIARDAAHDIHPPLYYWLLAGWTHVLGNSVLAVRSFSALVGTAVVGMVIALGWRLLDARSGLAAGALAALSPYLVWYSQEVRMYILAALWACLLVYGAQRLAEAEAQDRARRWAWTALATCCATAALYTQYLGGIGALAVGSAAVVLLAIAGWRTFGRLPRGLLGRWTLSQALALLLFLPWLYYAWPSLRDWPAVSPPVTATRVVGESAVTFALGARVPPESLPWSPLFLAMILMGLVAGLAIPRWRLGILTAALWAAIPPALVWLLSLARPAWNTKQLITAAPGWELLLGAAVMAGPALVERRAATGGNGSPARRWSALLAGIVLLLLLAPRAAALRAMYFDPAYQRDDYRGIAAEIERLAGPEDAVVLNAPTQVEVFGYYFRSGLAVYPLPRTRPADVGDTAERLAALGAQHRDLYAVLWATAESDPEAIVEGWLNAHRHKVRDTWHGNVRLAEWAQARPMAEVDVGTRHSAAHTVQFGAALLLAQIKGPTATVAPGGVLTLEAAWRPIAPPAADYVVFTQLLDDAGNLVAQRDMAPMGGTERTSSWQPGQAVTDRIGLRVPMSAAPGAYSLILGLYDPATGERLPVWEDGAVAADHVVVGKVHVSP